MTQRLNPRPTGDGSMTLHSSLYDACYHSHHGAIQESRHVFIRYGLEYFERYRYLRILELGFGTGLNAALTLEAFSDKKVEIMYHTIEKHPISLDDLKHLRFYDHLSDEGYQQLIALHQAKWGVPFLAIPDFSLVKHCCDFEDFSTDIKYDLIYHDAFAPSTQAKFWERPFLDFIYSITEQNGGLVTFCAKGSFKRALRDVGYEVEALPGPPGKREMTRALKK